MNTRGRKTRENWGSSIGFVLAAAGSAVGLGNIWKFPYITGENGGGAFVLVYLLCIAVIGLPVMLCEITLGRKTQRNPVGAFNQLCPSSSLSAQLLGSGLVLTGLCLLAFERWGFGIFILILGAAVFKWSWRVVGVMGVLAGFVILSFYSVVAGWTIGYTLRSATGSMTTDPAAQKPEILARMLLDDIQAAPEHTIADIKADKDLDLGEKTAAIAQAGQVAATSYIRQNMDLELAVPDEALTRRQFRRIAVQQLAESAGGAALLDHLVERNDGLETRLGEDGTVVKEYTRSFRTAVAGTVFGSLMDNPSWAIAFHFIFMLLCIGIVCLGVKGGIERASKILMPVLLMLLFVLIIRGVTLSGAAKGVSFYLSPDFTKLSAEGVLLALGHAFFSLSLGMGAMITYGSYVNKEQNLFLSALSVTGLDTLIALMAGLAIFPAVFAMGFDPGAGPGLVFVILPAVFDQMQFGMFWSALFFLLLFVAALTSGISLLEVVTAYFVDERKWSRKLAACVFGGIIFGLGCLAAISVGDWERIQWLQAIFIKFFGGVKGSFFDVLDNLASNWMLPLGGLFISLFVGWIWGTKKAVDEIRHGSYNFADVHVVSLLAGLKDDRSHNSDVHVATLASIWGVFIRFISPVAVLIAFFHTIGWLDLTRKESAAEPPPPTRVEEKAGQSETGKQTE